MRSAGPSVADLLAPLYRHYPRGVSKESPRHQASEESRRLACVHEAAAIACGKGYVPVPDGERVAIDPAVRRVIDALQSWKTFGERCRAAFPDAVVWDESGPFHDPGYRYSIAKPGYAHPSDDWYDPVCCMFSVLAPVFVIYTYDRDPDLAQHPRYDDFPARYHQRIEVFTELVADVFGFARLDETTLRAVVPDVVPYMSNYQLGEVTLMDALFSSRP